MDDSRMDKDERQAMMRAMMAEFFGGMGADEKQAMCATMMAKMTEGLDMKAMMPGMMMDMMAGGGPGGMHEMMAGKGPGGAGGKMAQMPEMMLTRMMPHCIGMMLPAIDPDRRGAVAAAVLTAVVEAGAGGMTDAQATAFRKTLTDVLNP